MKKIIVTFVIITAPSFALHNEKPSVEKAYLELAKALTCTGKENEAIEYYKKTLEYNATNQDALYDLGTMAHRHKNFEEAIHYFEILLEKSPHNFDVVMHMAASQFAANNFDEAINFYQKATQIKKTSVDAYLHLGSALQKKGVYDLALEAFRHSIDLNPKLFDAYIKCAHIFRDQHKYKQALQEYDKALELTANHVPTKLEKANILVKCGKPEESLAIYQSIIKDFPNNPKLFYNLGYIYRKTHEFDKAIEAYKRSIELESKNSSALLGLAHSYLTSGDYKHGWQTMVAYNEQARGSKSALPSISDLKDKTIFIGAEWSSEDMIQLIRYVKLLKEYGAQTLVQAPEQLVALLHACPYIDNVIPCSADKTPPYHFAIPLFNLPTLFDTMIETIPATIPYLYIPQEYEVTWKKNIQMDKQFKIGIFWHKSEPSRAIAEDMNIPFELFLPLLKLKTVSVYSLQNIQGKELSLFPYTTIIHQCGPGFTESEESFLHMAAVLKQFDLVITRDGALAHLAGALGIPVWVALPYTADWRWMDQRPDTPWYPTMRLYRQKQPGDWTSVIHTIVNEVKKIVSP